MRQLLIGVLCYLGMGISTNVFLFHLPILYLRRDPRAERLCLARSVPPLERLAREQGDATAERAVALAIVFLWPLWVVPLLRWMDRLQR